MLEKITIRNFQKHRKLEIELDPVCTTLVGKSDAGKSAVVRALRWVCQNKPSGDEFIRDGAKRVGVRIDMDGRFVARSKGDNDNAYHFDGDEFKAFGSTVPAPIADFLNVSDINFQGQFDAPFWLAESPGQISRALNAVVNLGIMDTTMANLASEVRRASTRLEMVEERLQKTRKERAELRWVGEFVQDLEKLEHREKKLTKRQQTIEELSSTLDEIDRAVALLKTAAPSITAGGLMVSTGGELQALGNRIDELSACLTEIEQQEIKLCDLKSELSGLQKKINAVQTCPLCGARMKK